MDRRVSHFVYDPTNHIAACSLAFPFVPALFHAPFGCNSRTFRAAPKSVPASFRDRVPTDIAFRHILFSFRYCRFYLDLVQIIFRIRVFRFPLPVSLPRRQRPGCVSCKIIHYTHPFLLIRHSGILSSFVFPDCLADGSRYFHRLFPPATPAHRPATHPYSRPEHIP